LIRPEIFARFADLDSGISTRQDPVVSQVISADERARTEFLNDLGIRSQSSAMPEQIHSDSVIRIDAPGTFRGCDGLVTNIPGIALTVKAADCVPILIYDPKNRVISAVHAGWRGVAKGIVKNAVEIVKNEYKTRPENIYAFIGPSAGVCCYEVDDNVAVMFKNKIVSYNKPHIDLKKENRDQLIISGVQEENIEVSSSCTICSANQFHSFRRDGNKAGRIIAAICMDK
jgi:polyphenol oxidase